jgi:hypothetical protein
MFIMLVMFLAIFPVPMSVGNKTAAGRKQTEGLVSKRIFFML